MKYLIESLREILPSLNTALLSNDHELLDRIKSLLTMSEAALHPSVDHQIKRWEDCLTKLPYLALHDLDLTNAIHLQGNWLEHSSKDALLEIKALLMQLHPWRKGPFKLPHFDIDTEWRSDWKWDRIQPHLHTLQDKVVLDIGCGNGYYMWRMCGAGARFVLGVDPSRIFHFQFRCFQEWFRQNLAHSLVSDSTHYKDPMQVKTWQQYSLQHIHHLPLTLEHMVNVGSVPIFDYVFSMGVLYHRRDPHQHLQDIKSQMKPNESTLVLETLVHQGSAPIEITSRYARMRNIWCLPDVQTLVDWVTQAGFTNIQVVDLTYTTIEEQRRTEWMYFESLSHSLDEQDHSKTIEGYPAPLRVTLVAQL